MNSEKCSLKAGDVLYSPKHSFLNGNVDDKFLILLNSPFLTNHLILIFVNSDDPWRNKTFGCHNEIQDGYFVIDQGQDFFNKPKTFVIFRNYQVLDLQEYGEQREKGNLEKKCSLRSNTLKAILDCYKHSHQINGFIKELLD